MDIIINHDGHNQLTSVTLTGSLDVSGAAEIDAGMRSTVNSGNDIAVDLSGVTFISSQGTRILVITSKAAVAKHKMLYLIAPKPPIRKALTTMGVDKIIPIYNSMDELIVARP